MSAPPPKRNVLVPIKIVVRGGGAPDGERMSDAIAESAGTQLGEALDLLDESGNPWRPAVGSFDVTFTGAAKDLSPEQQRELYAYVGDGLGNAAGVAQKKRGGTRRGSGKKQRKKARKTKKDKDPAAGTRSILTWDEFDSDDDETFHLSFHAAASAWLQAADRDVLPNPFGVLFRMKGETPIRLYIVDNGEYVCRRRLLRAEVKAGALAHAPADLAPQETRLYLEYLDDGLARWRANIAAKLSVEIGKESGAGGVNTEAAAQAIGDPLAEATKQAETISAGWDDFLFYEVHIGGGGIYPFDPAEYPKLKRYDRIDLIALVKRVEAEEGEEDADGADGADDDGPDLPDGGGGADQGQGRGSDVTAPAGQDVGKGGKGIVIGPNAPGGPYKVGGSIYPVLPPDPNSNGDELTCERYRDELSVKTIPSGGAEMERLIAEIAARLEMEPCEWPAHFCIQASRMLRIRASQIHGAFQADSGGDFYAELRVGGVDAQGAFVFRALDSVAVQYLQHLAGTVPKIRALMDLVRVHTFPVTRFAPHHWFRRAADEAFQACGLIWLVANQIMLQQLLDSSRRGVVQRQGNAEYYRVFAALCRSRLGELVELITLRTSLETFASIAGKRTGDDAHEAVRRQLGLEIAFERHWAGRATLRKEMVLADVTRSTSIATRLADETDFVFVRGLKAQVIDAGSIQYGTDGVWRVRASDGDLYSKGDLDRLIQLRQQVVSSIDPLISTLFNRLVTAIRPLIDDPSTVPAFLDKLFADMLAKNAEVSRKNRDDYEYAFEHAQMHRADRNAPAAVAIQETRLRGWSLQGIHALAHQHVGVRFEGDAFYAGAVDKLIGQEYYWRSFVEDMILVFGIAFTVVCPPLGAALSFGASLALGIEKYEHAKEQETIYGAVLEPENLLSYAEIQTDLFLAKLAIALSFLELVPYAGKGVKALTGLGKKAAKEGAEQGAKMLARELIEAELKQLSKTSIDDWAAALVLEFAQEAVEDRVVGALVNPIIEDHIKELEAELHREGLL